MSRRGPGQGLPEAVAAGQTAGGWDAHQGAGRGRGVVNSEGTRRRRRLATSARRGRRARRIGRTGTPALTSQGRAQLRDALRLHPVWTPKAFYFLDLDLERQFTEKNHRNGL